MKIIKLALASLLILSIFGGCKKGSVKEFLFPVTKDLELGQELADYIAANPAEYPLVDSSKNTKLYQEVYKIRDAILASGKVRYKDEFAWQVKIIDDNQTLNAFAAPGGFIYVYTGIISYLDNIDHFAGVMGHELAHADRRHSINQMIKNSGVQIFFDILLGDESSLAQVAGGLAGLKFSRGDEKDADEWSVEYLCNSPYESNGAAGFFQKLIDEESDGSTPEFLSTHPSPENRVQNINDNALDAGCTAEGEASTWSEIQTAAANIVR